MDAPHALSGSQHGPVSKRTLLDHPSSPFSTPFLSFSTAQFHRDYTALKPGALPTFTIAMGYSFALPNLISPVDKNF
jgi:hypothetical protein